MKTYEDHSCKNQNQTDASTSAWLGFLGSTHQPRRTTLSEEKAKLCVYVYIYVHKGFICFSDDMSTVDPLSMILLSMVSVTHG